MIADLALGLASFALLVELAALVVIFKVGRQVAGIRNGFADAARRTPAMRPLATTAPTLAVHSAPGVLHVAESDD